MEATAPARSNFVTVLAWIFIVMSGFSTLISILQNIMVHTMFSGPGFDELANSPASETVPAVAVFLAGHIQSIFLAVLLLSASTLASSIGLLRRRNWARLAFIGLMALGIAWNLLGFGLQFAIMRSFPSTFTEPNAGVEQFQAFMNVILVFSALFALAMSALFGWIIHKLLSAPIAAEFED